MSLSKVDLDYVYEKITDVINAVSKVYVGKRDVVKLAVATLMVGGHLLIEGYPGTGKTLLAKALSKAIGGEYRRIQGHPDVLPSDILGFHIYRPSGERFFVKGPVFSNILLFDELNRTPTRSQAALLEAMQEYQVSIDGITYVLPRPFMVIATQVPEPYATGSYKIMETLADRFALVMPSYYNPPEEEIEIVSKADVILNIPVEQVITLEDVDIIAKSVPYLVEVNSILADYMVRLVTYVRTHPSIAYGPSHRVTVDLMKLSRIIALLDKRSYVIPDDVKQLFIHAVPHRVKLKEEYELEGVQLVSIVNEALKNVPVPK
ncbi:MAG: MoxR family ATPase [Desulfurococcaceae archaeon]